MIKITDDLHKDALEGLNAGLAAEQSFSELVVSLNDLPSFDLAADFDEVTTAILEEVFNLCEENGLGNKIAEDITLSFDKKLSAFQDRLEKIEKLLDNLPMADDNEGIITSVIDKLEWSKLEVYKEVIKR